MRYMILFLGMAFLSTPSEALLEGLRQKLSAARDHVHHNLLGGCSVNAEDLAKGLSGDDGKKVHKCALAAVRILHDSNARLHQSLTDLTKKYPEAGAVLEKIAADETIGFSPNMKLKADLEGLSESKLKILAHLLSKHNLSEKQWEEELQVLEEHMSRHAEKTMPHSVRSFKKADDFEDVEDVEEETSSVHHPVHHEMKDHHSAVVEEEEDHSVHHAAHHDVKEHHEEVTKAEKEEETYVPRRRSRRGSSAQIKHDVKEHHEEVTKAEKEEEHYVPRRRSRRGSSAGEESPVHVSPNHFAPAPQKSGSKEESIPIPPPLPPISSGGTKATHKPAPQKSGPKEGSVPPPPPAPPLPAMLSGGGEATHKPAHHERKAQEIGATDPNASAGKESLLDSLRADNKSKLKHVDPSKKESAHIENPRFEGLAGQLSDRITEIRKKQGHPNDKDDDSKEDEDKEEWEDE